MRSQFDPRKRGHPLKSRSSDMAERGDTSEYNFEEELLKLQKLKYIASQMSAS